MENITEIKNICVNKYGRRQLIKRAWQAWEDKIGSLRPYEHRHIRMYVHMFIKMYKRMIVVFMWTYVWHEYVHKVAQFLMDC